MNKTESIKLARDAYRVIAAVAERHAETAKRHALEGERRHRRGDFRMYHPCAASAEVCAEMFVAKFTAQYLVTEKLPDISAVLYLRPDALICAGMVGDASIRGKLIEAFRNCDLGKVATLDYTALVGEVRPA